MNLKEIALAAIAEDEAVNVENTDKVGPSLAADILARLIGGKAAHGKDRFGFQFHDVEYGGSTFRIHSVRRTDKPLVVYKDAEHDEFYAFDWDLSPEEFTKQAAGFVEKVKGRAEATAEDAAPKKPYDIYKDFDQNLFEWGAIGEINRIRKAVAAKPKDSVVTDEEFRELNKPFYEVAKKYVEDNGFSPNKKWVKTTVLSVPKALANAFDTLSDGEGVTREYFLDVLTVEAVCALATEAVDSIRNIEDYYRKHKIKWDDEGYVIYRAPDFETPAWAEDAAPGSGEWLALVETEDAAPPIPLFVTSDIHSTGMKSLDPKGASMIVIAGDLMGGGMDSDDAGYRYLEEEFFPWCREHADKPIIITAGNHDKFLFRQWAKGKKIDWPKNVHYLVDRSETIDGLKFYGTPWCLKDRPGRFEGTEEKLKDYFSKIPKGVDVLIAHCPPYIPGEKVDANEDDLHEGSKELTEAILAKKPRFCVCGHVHSGSRAPVTLGDTKVVNVARVERDRHEAAHKPRILHIPLAK